MPDRLYAPVFGLLDVEAWPQPCVHIRVGLRPRHHQDMLWWEDLQG